jgi:hypothetical protein
MSTTATEAPVTEPAAQPAEPAAAAPQPPAAPAAPAQPAPVPSPPPQPRESPEAAVQPAQAPAQPAEPAGAPAEDVAALKAERDQLKAEAARWKQQSRAQEQRSKSNHAEVKNYQELTRRIAEHFGIEFDDKPDPDELTRKLADAQTANRQKSVELAVYTTAAGVNANAVALLDSREFMGRTAGLDPDAADFSVQVAELVREAAQQERYQVPKPPPVFAPAAPEPVAQQQPAQAPPQQPPAAANGADFSGAPGGNRLWTPADYDRYVATAGTEDRDGSKLSKAIQDGLLVNLGVGRPKHKSYGR